MPRANAIQVLKGTLDMMVLRVLVEEPRHGYGITRRLQEISDDAFQVDEGSMYPALYRMEERGLIEAEWFRTDNNRRARVYRLTDAGRARLADETARWARFSDVVSKVMAPAR